MVLFGRTTRGRVRGDDCVDVGAESDRIVREEVAAVYRVAQQEKIFQTQGVRFQYEFFYFLFCFTVQPFPLHDLCPAMYGRRNDVTLDKGSLSEQLTLTISSTLLNPRPTSSSLGLHDAKPDPTDS